MTFKTQKMDLLYEFWIIHGVSYLDNKGQKQNEREPGHHLDEGGEPKRDTKPVVVDQKTANDGAAAPAKSGNGLNGVPLGSAESQKACYDPMRKPMQDTGRPSRAIYKTKGEGRASGFAPYRCSGRT
jgi:hypothetical protein